MNYSKTYYVSKKTEKGIIFKIECNSGGDILRFQQRHTHHVLLFCQNKY